MPNRLSRKRRARIKAAIAAKVRANLNGGLDGVDRSSGSLRSHSSRDSLRAATHLGVKTQLHEGASRVMVGDYDNVVHVRPKPNLTPVERKAGFHKRLEPKPFRTTAPKSKRFREEGW